MTSLGALARTTARELMQAEVVTLAHDASVEEAVQTLEEYHIGGAPVTDGAGNLVGFLSAHDIARREHVREGRLEGGRERADAGSTGEEDEDWSEEEYALEDYGPELLGRRTVAEWMSPHVVSVAPDASLASICRTMVRESIHRVLVLEGRSVRGIVSTFDVVRFLAERL